MGIESIVPRKGYSRRADVPAKVLRALNRGEDEPRTLAEWLAIDATALLKAILPGVGLRAYSRQLIGIARKSATDGIMRRQRAIGVGLFEVARQLDGHVGVHEALAGHRSSVVREWAAMMLPANPALTISERLAGARRFAADPNMGVREIAWMSYRPFLAKNLDDALEILSAWVRDPEPSIRRCAIESTRPRGVWCEHLAALKQAPDRALHLLEALRADPSRYVQLSVGNWLNDASKSKPEWVKEVCARWTRQSREKATALMTARALRTITRVR